MWLTALFSAIPAVTNLFKRDKGGSAASSALASCQLSLQEAVDIARRMTTQRNAALVALPIAAVAGYFAGRRSR